MPADTETQPKKAPQATWRDWIPDLAEPAVMTRDELLETLRGRGIDIAPSTLEFYRYTGILPRPIRRRYEGVTVAVYPEWFVLAIEHIKRQQEAGKTLDAIKPHMPALARSWALALAPMVDPVADPTRAMDEALRAYARAMQPWLADRGVITSVHVELRDADNTVLDYHDVPFGA